MLITVEEARHEPVRWEEVVELDPAELELPELASLGAVSCTGTVSPAQDGFLVRAHLEYTQGLVCTRCLEPSNDEVGCDFQLLVLVGEESDGGQLDPEEEIELVEEDLDTMTLAGEVLDTVPLIQEQIQLGVPMKPLCAKDCKGLCSSCGANLNEGSCDCVPAADPRWSGLEALKSQLGASSKNSPES